NKAVFGPLELTLGDRNGLSLAREYGAVKRKRGEIWFFPAVKRGPKGFRGFSTGLAWLLFLAGCRSGNGIASAKGKRGRACHDGHPHRSRSASRPDHHRLRALWRRPWLPGRLALAHPLPL